MVPILILVVDKDLVGIAVQIALALVRLASWAPWGDYRSLLVSILRAHTFLVSDCGVRCDFDDPASLDDPSLSPLPCFYEVKLDLALSFSFPLFLLSLSLSTVDVFFPSRHPDKVRRLPFGVAAASAIFQRFMETMLSGIHGTCVYLDDIVVNGVTMEERQSRIEMVLDHLKTADLRLSHAKASLAFLK